MQVYQDTKTGEEWHFDDGVDVSSLDKPYIPKTISAKVIPKPSPAHTWVDGRWVLVAGAAETLFAKAIAAANSDIDLLHSEYLISAAGGASQVERDTWGGKADLAKLILAGQPISADGEAFLTSAGIEDRTVWAAKVLEKSIAYFTAVGLAESLRKKHKMAIAAAQNQVDLDALMVSARADWENLGKQP